MLLSVFSYLPFKLQGVVHILETHISWLSQTYKTFQNIYANKIYVFTFDINVMLSAIFTNGKQYLTSKYKINVREHIATSKF